ncbi:MAG: DUF3458 domain-containing protein [Hyphomicrobiales bacterium]
MTCLAMPNGLSGYAKWYGQAGTPVVTAKGQHDPARRDYVLSLSQFTSPTAGEPGKLPLAMPLGLGLITPEGATVADVPAMVELASGQTSLTIRNVAQRPALSLNRGFSAPIVLHTDNTPTELLVLLAHDSDTFNRWEAGQALARQFMLRIMAEGSADVAAFATALGRVLADHSLDAAYRALMLDMPPEAEIAALIGANVDSEHVAAARRKLRTEVARHLLPILDEIIATTGEPGPYQPDAASTGRRALRYAALALLTLATPDRGLALAATELEQAGSMTAEMGALAASLAFEQGAELRARFIARHKDDPLLVDKWLALAAAAPLPGAAARVEALETNPLFSWTRPNKVYALLGGLAANFCGFHDASGEGYRVLADAIIRLDGINPQVAARMATSFRSWKLFEATRRSHARTQMERILRTEKLSQDVFEIITRTSA